MIIFGEKFPGQVSIFARSLSVLEALCHVLWISEALNGPLTVKRDRMTIGINLASISIKYGIQQKPVMSGQPVKAGVNMYIYI